MRSAQTALHDAPIPAGPDSDRQEHVSLRLVDSDPNNTTPFFSVRSGGRKHGAISRAGRNRSTAVATTAPQRVLEHYQGRRIADLMVFATWNKRKPCRDAPSRVRNSIQHLQLRPVQIDKPTIEIADFRFLQDGSL